MRSLQAELSAPRFRGRIDLRATRNVADPKRAHEFEARQSAQIVSTPLIRLRVFRPHTGDRIAHDRVAEVVNYRGDGKCATKAVVQTGFGHDYLPAHDDRSCRPSRFRSPPARADPLSKVVECPTARLELYVRFPDDLLLRRCSARCYSYSGARPNGFAGTHWQPSRRCSAPWPRQPAYYFQVVGTPAIQPCHPGLGSVRK